VIEQIVIMRKTLSTEADRWFTPATSSPINMNTIINSLSLGLWCLTPLLTIYQLYRSSKLIIDGETVAPVINHRPVASDRTDCYPEKNIVNRGRSVVFSIYFITKKTDCYDITEILLKMAINTKVSDFWFSAKSTW
jgi:hypothetical protein